MSIYLTALLPPHDLDEQINGIRQEISDHYRVYKALKPPVHITLFRPVHLDASKEDQLIRLLKPVTLRHQPLEIHLENFDSFNNHTLYIRVVKDQLLSTLQKDVASVFNKNRIDPREVKGNTGFTPHVTVAYRDVSPDTFSNLWNEFENRKFKRSFTAESFCLLKHDGERWNVLQTFALRKPEMLSLF